MPADPTMTWWMWITLGLVLAGIELATPGGFFVIFFGVAAIVVGVLDLMGVLHEPWLQWLLFSVMAVAALRLFRRPLLARIQQGGHAGEVDSLIGETAIAAGPIAPGERGRVELRGSVWNGHNVGTRTIAATERCRVVAVDGLQLDIAP